MSHQPKGRTGGTLPIHAAAIRKPAATQKPAQRSPAPRLRLLVRRLPPGLTEDEFWEVLGTDWQAGNGKVDWHSFKQGKISKDPSKPSRPARAYLKVKDQPLIQTLSARVKAITFKDAKNTTNDVCLVGPPSLEFAPYNKVPSSRNRHDGRQGTIDQDQEFIDFLQSLTEPIVKPATNGADATDGKQERVTITPLVQFIKEKKANKAKDKEAAAAAKNSKKNQDGKDSKPKGESRPTVVVKGTSAAAEKNRVAKTTQDAPKTANKAANQNQNKSSGGKSEQKAQKEPAPQPTPTPKPERQRGSASAASRMIARDLGLTPKEPRTPKAAKNATAAGTTTSDSTPKVEVAQKGVLPAPAAALSTPKATPSTPMAAASTPPTGPRNNRANQVQQQKPAQQTPQRPAKPPPQPTPGAKSAFLKHANPSQGVTEELLRTTFSTFGEVTRCEIDKKKGLGYVDFADAEALKKAMAASPVKIGNGQVVVLENKSPYNKRQPQAGTSQPARAATPVSQPRSAAVSAVASPQQSPAVVATTEQKETPAAASTTTPAAEGASVSAVQPSTDTPPTAPKGSRSGNSAARAGGRGNTAFAANRGSPHQNPNRGRGGFRGGRGRSGRGGGGGGGGGAGAGAGNATGTPTTATAPNATSSAASGGGSGEAKSVPPSNAEG